MTHMIWTISRVNHEALAILCIQNAHLIQKMLTENYITAVTNKVLLHKSFQTC